MPYINFEYYFKCDIIFLVIFLFTIMNNKNEFIINKSKFITLIFNINNKEDIDNILAKTKEEYIDIVCSQLELLNKDIVIERLTADPNPDKLIAPTWTLKKFCVLNDIDKEMKKRDSYQGKYQEE